MTNVSMIHNSMENLTETEIVTVQGGSEHNFMVLSSLGVLRASVAFSCLVVPREGDRVLLSRCNNENHILAIIERPDVSDMAISFPGNVAMQAKSGSISMVAQHKLSLTSAKQTQITSTELAINTMKTNVLSQELLVKGDKVTSEWRQINVIAKVFHFLTDTLTQHIKNSFKVVEGVDQLKSLNYMQTVDKTLSIRSRDAVITARKDIKIDGERIHMG